MWGSSLLEIIAKGLGITLQAQIDKNAPEIKKNKKKQRDSDFQNKASQAINKKDEKGIGKLLG
jgi:hypothetical protein